MRKKTPTGSSARKRQWLVSARADVQHLLLETRCIVQHRADQVGKPISKTDTYVLRTLTDSVFCLWRAVFLLEDSYPVSAFVEHMIKFMDFLIDDNIVNYPQDKKARYFSALFYIRSANLRLEDLVFIYQAQGAEIFSNSEWAIFEPAYEKLVKARTKASEKEGFSNYQNVFDAALDALMALNKALARRYGVEKQVAAETLGSRPSRFPRPNEAEGRARREHRRS